VRLPSMGGAIIAAAHLSTLKLDQINEAFDTLADGATVRQVIML